MNININTWGVFIIILGILLYIITYRVTQNDNNKTRRYVSLSAGTLIIIIGYYLMMSQKPYINEKISIDDIKTKVQQLQTLA